jgi:uncharacterized protein (DUF433 family)
MTALGELRFDESLDESPRIKGSRISAIQIYEMHVLRGLTTQEIAEKYEALDLEAVKQAVKYCISHPDEVRRQATSPLTVEIAERQSRSQGPASA